MVNVVSDYPPIYTKSKSCTNPPASTLRPKGKARLHREAWRSKHPTVWHARTTLANTRASSWSDFAYRLFSCRECTMIWVFKLCTKPRCSGWLAPPWILAGKCHVTT
jgi:hypothetical protein